MKSLVAECFGTFCLVFVGTGAIVMNAHTDGALTHLGVSLAFGLVVMAMIYAVGDVSGAHINPAVTFGFWLSGRLPGKSVIPYMVSQAGGAALASLAVRGLMPAHANLGMTLPQTGVWPSFGLEILLTLILMLVILRVSTQARETGIMAGIAVGAVIAFEALVGGPISGASMNPARSLAPALVMNGWAHQWIYLTAPFLGAAVAVPLCRLMPTEGCCVRDQR